MRKTKLLPHVILHWGDWKSGKLYREASIHHSQQYKPRIGGGEKPAPEVLNRGIGSGRKKHHILTTKNFLLRVGLGGGERGE